MANLLVAIIRFLMMAVTDLAMLPALYVMQNNRRHFECFIGCFHLTISVIFNVSGAFGINIFLSELEWHSISDILSITYALLLIVHVMAIENEQYNILLRYLAFSLSWISQLKDKWDSTTYQSLLIALYLIGLILRYTMSGGMFGYIRNTIDFDQAMKAGVSLTILALTYILSIQSFFSADPLNLLYAIYHVAGGSFFYFSWKCIPFRDEHKKDDDFVLPIQAAYV